MGQCHEFISVLLILKFISYDSECKNNFPPALANKSIRSIWIVFIHCINSTVHTVHCTKCTWLQIVHFLKISITIHKARRETVLQLLHQFLYIFYAASHSIKVTNNLIVNFCSYSLGKCKNSASTGKLANLRDILRINYTIFAIPGV